MIKLAAFFAFVLATHAIANNATTLDAAEITTVAVDASLYDTTLSIDGGCDPIGCVGNLTRVSGGYYYMGCGLHIIYVYFSNIILLWKRFFLIKLRY